MCYNAGAGQGREHGGFCFQEPARALTTAYRCGQSPRSIGTPRAVLAGSAGNRWDGGSVMATVTRVCPKCGRTYSVPLFRVHEGVGKFCSQQCSREARSWRTTVHDRFWAKVDKSAGPDGCWLWCGGVKAGGYGRFHLHGGPSGNCAAHRFAYEDVCGSIPVGLQACHKCDNRLCVNPAHIFLGTNDDNMADKIRKGRARSPQGVANGRSRLTEADVVEIRRLYAVGNTTMRRLALRFDVTVGTIHEVVSRRTWQHIP